MVYTRVGGPERGLQVPRAVPGGDEPGKPGQICALVAPAEAGYK